MKKIFSKKLWIALISGCGIGTGIALACAGGWGEEYGTSNFSPEIFVDSAYSPFFYSDQFYYGIGHDQSQQVRFNNSNIKEWSAYLNKQVSNTELRYLLETASVAAVDSAARYMSGKNKLLSAYLPSLKDKNKRVAAFIDYLQLARQCEAFSLNEISNDWETDSTTKKTVKNAVALNRNLDNSFARTTDLFLKERYWFQLIRSYFFNGSPQQAIDLFTSTEKVMPHDNMYYRSMAYAAGAFYKLKNYSSANYYYSKVYDGCNELKTTAHFSFHPQEEKDWNATLALCKSNDEKATLWQMLGIFYSDEQRAINEIYQLNPASDKLELLLARAVNKYEQKFSLRENNYTPVPVDTVAMTTLPALVTRIATAGNTGKPWAWQMAAGYLQMLDAKYPAATVWFARAAKTIPGSKAPQAQLRLLKLINSIGQVKRIDAKFENTVLNDIEWLSKFEGSTIPVLRYNDAFSWIKEKMAAKYLLQNEWVKSNCFSSKAGFYADNKNVADLKTFLVKNDKTAYEKLCAALCVMKIPDLFAFQAIRLTYADSLDAAIEKMADAGPDNGIVLPGNPFNGRIQDCHDCDHAAAQKIKYSKLAFLKKIKELKDKTTAGEDVYNNALLLANAYYNISYFGNARAFYESNILGSGHSDPYYIDSVFRKMLTAMGMAAKYYNLSLQNASTDEQKAKCQYMLAKCQRNKWYNENIYNSAENRYGTEKLLDFTALAGFRALKQYSKTQYYKDVLNECGYFKMYTGK
ncbi:MAG: hypothetical protein ABIQ88_08495 [Chitinophagaceae bacterium]